MYVGVDPSIENTGVVALDNSGGVIGCFNSKHRQGKMKRTTPFYKYLRYNEIAGSVCAFLADCMQRSGAAGCIIGYEDYSYDSENKAFTIGEFGGVLKLALVSQVGGVLPVAPQRVKKFAGCAQTAKPVKEAQAESAYIRDLPKRQQTTDICDAYFLAKIAWYVAAPRSAASGDRNHVLLRERLSLAKTIHKEIKDSEQRYFGHLDAWQRHDGNGRAGSRK